MPASAKFIFHDFQRMTAIEATRRLADGIRDHIMPIFKEAEDAIQSYETWLFESVWDDKQSDEPPTVEELEKARGTVAVQMLREPLLARR